MSHFQFSLLSKDAGKEYAIMTMCICIVEEICKNDEMKKKEFMKQYYDLIMASLNLTIDPSTRNLPIFKDFKDGLEETVENFSRGLTGKPIVNDNS